MNIDNLKAINPNNIPAIKTHYGEWLIDHHSPGFNRITDLKAYMTDCGLVPGVDFLGAELGETLRGIHDITFHHWRKSTHDFEARIADYIAYLDNQSPIVSDSHYMLYALYKTYGKAVVQAEIERQFDSNLLAL